MYSDMILVVISISSFEGYMCSPNTGTSCMSSQLCHPCRQCRILPSVVAVQPSTSEYIMAAESVLLLCIIIIFILKDKDRNKAG